MRRAGAPGPQPQQAAAEAQHRRSIDVAGAYLFDLLYGWKSDTYSSGVLLEPVQVVFGSGLRLETLKKIKAGFLSSTIYFALDHNPCCLLDNNILFLFFSKE